MNGKNLHFHHLFCIINDSKSNNNLNKNIKVITISEIDQKDQNTRFINTLVGLL